MDNYGFLIIFCVILVITNVIFYKLGVRTTRETVEFTLKNSQKQLELTKEVHETTPTQQYIDPEVLIARGIYTTNDNPVPYTDEVEDKLYK